MIFYLGVNVGECLRSIRRNTPCSSHNFRSEGTAVEPYNDWSVLNMYRSLTLTAASSVVVVEPFAEISRARFARFPNCFFFLHSDCDHCFVSTEWCPVKVLFFFLHRRVSRNHTLSCFFVLENGIMPAYLTFPTDWYLWVLSLWYPLFRSTVPFFRFSLLWPRSFSCPFWRKKRDWSCTDLLANTAFRFPWRTVSLFSVFARLLSIAIQISCWVSFSKLLLLEETVFTAGIETIVLDLLIYIMTNHFFQSRLTGQCFFLHCILLIQSHERSQFLKVLELEQNFQFVFVWIFSWREQVVAVKKECRLYHLYWRSQRSCKRFIFHSWIDSRVFSWSSVLETVLVTPSLDFAS